MGVSTNLSDYYVNLRMALSDQGVGGVYAWKDESLSGALRSVVEMGLGPKGVSMATGKPALDPAPQTPDARGYLIFQAALLLMGGRNMVSFKTRAMQARVDPAERLLTVDHLRRQIRRLETQGDPHGTGGAVCFAVWSDLENEIERSAGTPERVVV